MSPPSEHSIELAEGNRTLYTLLSETLEEKGFEVRSQPEEEPTDLLAADVDSGVSDLEERFESYRESSRPIVLYGVRGSNRDYDEPDEWLDRPFEPAEFVAACRRALGLEERDSFAEIDETDAGESQRDGTDDEDADEPEAAESGEIQIDLDPEADAGDEEGEVLEIDDASSMVLDVSEVEELEGGYGSGGSLGESTEREALDVESLEEAAEDLETGAALSDPEANPTLPEVPDGGERPGSAPEESSSIRQVDSNAGPASGAESTGARSNPAPGSGPVEPDSVVGAQVPGGDGSPPAARGGESGPSPGGEPDLQQPSGRRISPEFERELSEMAGLLAESWGRLGLTARWEDRTERLKRIFSALVEGGLGQASEELERIPPAHGFTGALEVFPPLDLVRLIRRRGFLGRLEISNESDGYVLYFDANRLVGIDDLEGRSEAMLLDCLRESASVDDELYRELRNTVEDSLAAPLEMRLRTEQLVTEEQLLDARRTRAKRVVEEVLNATTGNFAFIHGGDESGQPWPVNELGLSVDVLLLELLRNGDVESTTASEKSAEAFVTAGDRLGDEQQTALALVEREILDVCRNPASRDDIVREIGGDPAEVEGAVERLRAVGFLHPTTKPEETGFRSGAHRSASSEATVARERPTSDGSAPSSGGEEAEPGSRSGDVTPVPEGTDHPAVSDDDEGTD